MNAAILLAFYICTLILLFTYFRKVFSYASMLISIIVVSAMVNTHIVERFVARKALCDCCGCRMVDCDRCLKNVVGCCGGSFNYTRYSF